AYEGTLENPHLGATIIMELASFHSNDDSNQVPFSAADGAADSAEWILSGPGIPGEKRLWTSGKSHWMERRNSRNSEYPLGLDLVLIHSDGYAAALPRTTRINRVGKEL
ncbi:MAG: phosphonate C-P lyase system protein PhnH, partial [Spirochaetaceae bacterium]|nr:phosphonate C-P lyase system protein PhnH [Spirochaetaceae bacterium]